MKNYIKTILSAVQTWTKGKIKDSTADWNENDSNADSYVKNRTHWEEANIITLVDNLTSEDYNNGNNVPECNFVPGQTYSVIWNGTLYDGLICYIDGDYNVIASDNLGCPFYIDDDGGNGLYISTDNEESYTISISTIETIIHKLDEKYLDLPENIATTDDVQSAMDAASAAQSTADTAVTNAATAQTTAATAQSTADTAIANAATAQSTADSKMDATNPVGTGSFSMNRKSGTTVGAKSYAIGADTTASGDYSYAEGVETTASGISAHAEGRATRASGINSHAEGQLTKALGAASHAEGYNTIAASNDQHVQGQHNIEDTTKTYAHIVGNGTNAAARSNAHTLDWEGNAWYQGDIYVGSASGTNKDDGSIRLARIDEIPSIESLATEEYVNTSIANLVDSAPETLDTLNELATALQENQDLTTILNQAIGEKATLEDLNNHKNDTEVHITAAERESWNSTATTLSNLNQGLTLTDTVTGINYMITIANGKVTITEVSE